MHVSKKQNLKRSKTYNMQVRIRFLGVGYGHVQSSSGTDHPQQLAPTIRSFHSKTHLARIFGTSRAVGIGNCFGAGQLPQPTRTLRLEPRVPCQTGSKPFCWWKAPSKLVEARRKFTSWENIFFVSRPYDQLWVNMQCS